MVMKKESLINLLNENVKVVCSYPNNKIMVFKGKIININDDALILFDFREKKNVLLDLSLIKEVWQLGDENEL